MTHDTITISFYNNIHMAMFKLNIIHPDRREGIDIFGREFYSLNMSDSLLNSSSNETKLVGILVKIVKSHDLNGLYF